MGAVWKGGLSPWKDSSGRNHHGKITVRHRGAGVKKHLRNITWEMDNNEQFKVIALDYDPHRTAKIAFIQNKDATEKHYVLASETLRAGDHWQNVTNVQPTLFLPGSVYTLYTLPIGSEVSNIDNKWIRAGGTAGIVMEKRKENEKTRVLVRMPSGEARWIPGQCTAILGRMSMHDKVGKRIKNAGTNRRLGIRPHVRGVAMNPVDHPHGGGEGKASGGRPSVTPWGKPTKGQPTRRKAWPSCVAVPRKRKNK